MKTIWILIANTTTAKIYQIDEKDAYTHEIKYHLITELHHEQSRLKTGEINSDKPGHYQSGTSGHGSFSPAHDAHDIEHLHFAKIIGDYLNKERTHNHYEQLIICAEPHFYGLLNKNLSQQVQNLISKHIAKDYVPLPHGKLLSVLQEIIEDAN